MSGAPALDAEDLEVRHRGSVVAGPVSLRLERGATLGLQGPSGCGKSTTLRALVGLLPDGLTHTGRVEVLGTDLGAVKVDLPALRARAVLVGQSPVVFPASILANAAFGLRHVARLSRSDLRDRAETALVEAGLWSEVEDRLGAPASQLSAGQRQRLCLARALALDPELLLLDEPTSSLDPAATAAVEKSVRGLRRRRTVLVVSHDGPQLVRLCDDVVVLAAPADHQ